MSKLPTQYPPDEFDSRPPDSPVGAHRRPKTVLQRLLPYLVTLVIGALLAYGAVWAISQLGAGRTPSAPPTSSATSDTDLDEPTQSPDGEDPPEDETPEPEPEPDPEPILSTSVTVLNGAGISGLAGRVSSAVGELGFQDVTAGNLSGDRPEANVVRYVDDEHEFTAQFIADQLGIDEIAQVDDLDDEIVVVLVSDLS